MRAYIFAALMAAGPAFADDLVARDGQDMVRLQNKACYPDIAAMMVNPEQQEVSRAGIALMDGREIRLCWMLTARGIAILDEDGDRATLSVSMFKREPGV